jgi:hypothetical protein
MQGVRKTHQEFLYDPSLNISGSRAVHGWSAIGVPSNSDDCMGHGTHVSGTIGGLTYGVAKNATIHAGLRPFMHPETDLQKFWKFAACRTSCASACVCVCACLEYRLQKKTSVKPACYISIPKLVLVDVLRVLWTGRATTQGNSDPLPMPHFVLVDAVKMLECQGNS